MVNKEFQERILSKWNDGSCDYSFIKSNSCRDKYKDTPNYSLIEFLKKNEYCVILSKACKKVKGLNYKAVYLALKELKIKSKTLPFTDEEYLPAIENIRAILIEIRECKRLLAYFGLNKKEISNAVYSSMFNYKDYNKFLVKRHRGFVEDKIKNDKFFDEISIDKITYYKKEYVSEHKYAADFLQEYVERNKANATDGEKAMKDVLEKNGIVFEFQKPCLVCGKSYIMDFFLPNYGVCIEVDGGYHDTQEQLIKDRERTNRLAMTGILVVRFTNEEALDRRKVKYFIDNVLQRTI